MSLQTVQKRDQVGLLLSCKSYTEALVVKREHVVQSRSRSVVEVRRAGSEPAQDGAFDLADVCPEAGYESTAGIGGLHDRSRRVVSERKHWQIAQIQRAGQVANPNVQRRWKGMVAHIGTVMASSAGAR